MSLKHKIFPYIFSKFFFENNSPTKIKRKLSMTDLPFRVHPAVPHSIKLDYVCLCRVFEKSELIKTMFLICLTKTEHNLSGWPSGLRRQTQVLVFVRGRGFKSHF
jgi:hypothetical protein